MEEFTIEQKASVLGELLATTSFPPKVMQRILDNLNKMTESDMDILIESLTNERSRLAKMAVMFADFAEYVDDKMNMQTSKSVEEIAVLTAEQNALMDEDMKELSAIMKKSKETQS